MSPAWVGPVPLSTPFPGSLDLPPRSIPTCWIYLPPTLCSLLLSACPPSSSLRATPCKEHLSRFWWLAGAGTGPLRSAHGGKRWPGRQQERPHALGTRHRGYMAGAQHPTPALPALSWGSSSPLGLPLLYPAAHLCPQHLGPGRLDPVWGFKAQGGVEGAREGLEHRVSTRPWVSPSCLSGFGAPPGREHREGGAWSPVPGQTQEGQSDPTSVALWPSTPEVARSGTPKTP